MIARQEFVIVILTLHHQTLCPKFIPIQYASFDENKALVAVKPFRLRGDWQVA
jgi:hypothetical protein